MTKSLLLVLTALLLSACTPPGTLRAPQGQSLQARLVSPDELAKLPTVPTRVRPGDTLRIVRDAQDGAPLDVRSLVEDSVSQTYTVRPDGTFSFRYAGRVDAAGKTPDEIAADLRSKLDVYYREPGVTVNIVSSPSSKVVIGGAVRTPGALDVNAVANLEQALFTVGGMLPTASPDTIALLRLDNTDRYQVYFLNLSGLIQQSGGEGRMAVSLQRGDIIFVPKSTAGNAADGVDLYFNQLLPFTRSLGVSFSKSDF